MPDAFISRAGSVGLAASLTMAYLWLFWLVYVLVMGLYRAHLARRLTPFAYGMALPVVALGFTVDVVANLVIAPLVFLELPREWLVTQRLIRLNQGPEGWRRRLATSICTSLLDVFDPSGDHC